MYGFYLEFDPSDQDARFRANIDDVVGSSDYVGLALNPQQVSYSEPFATAITFSQGGGKIIESRGQLVKSAVIVGTTGLHPLLSRREAAGVASSTRFSGRLVDESTAANESRANRSGYKAFLELKHLFNKFGLEKRKGNQVRMHYFDTKYDEFWLIEPQVFVLRLSSGRNFLHDYEIRFTCIEPSGSSIVTRRPRSSISLFDRITDAVLSPGTVAFGTSLLDGSFASGLSRAVGLPAVRSAIGRMRELVANGRAAVGAVPYAIGELANQAVDAVHEIVSLYDEGTSLVHSMGLLVQSSIAAFEAAKDRLFNEMPRLYTYEEMSDGPAFEWNEWVIEATSLVDHLAVSPLGDQSPLSSKVVEGVSSFAEVRGKEGFTTDFMPEKGSPLPVNPFVGEEDRSPVADSARLLSTDGFRSVVVNRGETIYDVARRTMGTIYAFTDLVFVNDLSFPYIVAELVGKPSGTIAWGEYIKVPVRTGTGSTIANDPPTPPVASFAGSITATGSSLEVVCASHDPWREDQWIGFTVTLLSGSGTVDPVRYVVSNTEDTLTLNRAWAVTPTIGDDFSLFLDEFVLRSPPSLEEIAYGRDALLLFDVKNGVTKSPLKAKAVLNSLSDVATLAGLENYIQALRLRMATNRGGHPFDSFYGLSLPIGRPASTEILPLYTFYARQSLLEDVRTDTVTDLKLSFSSGTARVSMNVRPVNAQRASSVELSR